jgi:DNA-directed RNA polymerase subunit RPC12/RpoP
VDCSRCSSKNLRFSLGGNRGLNPVLRMLLVAIRCQDCSKLMYRLRPAVSPDLRSPIKRAA